MPPTEASEDVDLVDPVWFWRGPSNLGEIIPPPRLSQLLNSSWLPAPQDNTPKRKVDLEPQPALQTFIGPLTRSKAKLKQKAQSLRSQKPPRIQTYSSTRVATASRWYGQHLHCDLSMQRVCRLPTVTLDKIFALVNDLVDNVSDSNGGEVDKVLSDKVEVLNPWGNLMPPAVFSKVEITSFYSNLLDQTFLPALSMLLTRKCVDASHGEYERHPRFFKVAKDTQNQSRKDSLRVMVSSMSTLRPDVLVSLETFGAERCTRLLVDDPEDLLSSGEDITRKSVAFNLEAVAPGLQHLALGETKTPGSLQGQALLTELPERKYNDGTYMDGVAWNVPTCHKCTCVEESKSSDKYKDHVEDLQWKWDVKSKWDRDAKREGLLWDLLGVMPPTLTTAIPQHEVLSDIFFEVLNQVSPTTA